MTIFIVSISIPKVKNAVLKDLVIFGQEYLPQSIRLLEGRGVEMLFGRMPFEHAVSLHGASLSKARVVVVGKGWCKTLLLQGGE